jgi:outer membrane protein OmpA-like peptidoglycan-associated protein
MDFRYARIAAPVLLAAVLILPASPGHADEALQSEAITNALIRPSMTRGPGSGIRGPGSETRGLAPSIDLPIPFAVNSHALTSVAQRQLDELGRALSGPLLAKFDFLIAGHTDSTGSEAYNQLLSERRARTVLEYLIGNFPIARERVASTGWGETRPKPDTDPESGANRRVEIINLENAW